MSLSEFYFSFKGRVSRADYWLKFALPLTGILVVCFIIDSAMGTLNAELGLGLFSGIVFILSIWPSLAISVRRLKDRDRNPWLLLLNCVPIVNIWISIELYFLGGTDGSNQYGPDPRYGAELSSPANI